MYGRNSPCLKCTPFKAFVTADPVVSEWHCDNGKTYMTVAEPLPYDLPLVVEFAVELNLPDSRGKGPGLLLRIKEGLRIRSTPAH